MLLNRSYAIALVGAGVVACASDTVGPAPQLQPNQVLAIDATVKHLSTVEGGCWTLETQRGRYEPVDLPAEFRVAGKPVRVVLRAADGWASFCMVGAIVHVDTISAR